MQVLAITDGVWTLALTNDGRVVEYLNNDGIDNPIEEWSNLKSFYRDEAFHYSMSNLEYVKNFVRATRYACPTISEPAT